MDQETIRMIITASAAILGGVIGAIATNWLTLHQFKAERKANLKDARQEAKIETYRQYLILLERYRSHLVEAYRRETHDHEDLLDRQRALQKQLISASLLSGVEDALRQMRLAFDITKPMYETSKEKPSAERANEWELLIQRYAAQEDAMISAMRSSLELDHSDI